MIIASFVSNGSATTVPVRVMPTFTNVLLTHPRYTSCNKDSLAYVCVNYRNNVCQKVVCSGVSV